MKINTIVFSVGSLRQQLLERYTFEVLEGLSELALDVFCDFLLDGVQCSSLDVTPASYFDAAGLTGDDAVICRIVWQDKHVAAALTALDRYREVLAVHKNLRFQS